MPEYEFVLTLTLPADASPDKCLERLYEAGCDDALVGTGRHGVICLDFIREAESALVAVSSAVGDVKEALPESSLIEVGPDLVSLTDISDLLNCSRQNVRKLIYSTPNSPVPAYSKQTTIWHLDDVLNFLKTKEYPFDRNLSEIATTTRAYNCVRSLRSIDPEKQTHINTVLNDREVATPK